MKNNEYMLFIFTEAKGTEMFFKSELEMKNWLIDNEFKTIHKGENCEIYHRLNDDTTASYQRK